MPKFPKLIFIFSVLLLTALSGSAQKGLKMKNLENFDRKPYHFGFILGVNRSFYVLEARPDISFQDSLLGISNNPQSGFNLALLASLDLSPNIHIRFLPGLSFQDRGVVYRFLQPENKVVPYTQKTEAVYLDFPINFKFRTNRVNNFAAYALFGGKYSIDMQSQKDVDNSGAVKIIRTESHDYSLDVGAGVDFFLPYFKFGIELKSAIGLKNILIPEETIFSRQLEGMYTRTFVVSFTFEG